MDREIKNRLRELSKSNDDIAELEAEVERLRGENKRLAKYAKGWHDGYKKGRWHNSFKQGMEQAVKIVATTQNIHCIVRDVIIKNIMDDMKKHTDLEKCTTYTCIGDRCQIKCKLGFWMVEGTDGLALINEAKHYFQQYKDDGEYDELLQVKGSE